VDAAIESWAEALDSGDGTVDRTQAGGLHRKIGSGHWHKGDRAASIAEFQKGIDLLKDGEPSRELIELYEEAASLYVETGDNMLAIYAAEKAQRLAEALGQSATASRAHLTYGRVFGRIGDLEQARRSLERSVELARQSGPAEVIRALLALGRHLETGEADYGAATASFREALALADELGDVPAQIELHAALGQLAVHPARWQEVDEHAAVAARLAEREGLSGQLALPFLLQGIAAWRRADWSEADTCLRRSHGIAAEGGRSEVAFSALLWLASVERDRGDLEAARTALEKAAEVCERAGLTAQAAEAASAQIAVMAAAGRFDEAREAAEAVKELLAAASDPVGMAGATEARGVTASDPGSSDRLLREAVDRWEGAGRPLNAIRARLLLARSLETSDPAASAEALADAAAAAERLDVFHLTN
jgi:SWI/SNF-related matrix-associated actin-dependent regulator 1 of chromatin subfamily A